MDYISKIPVVGQKKTRVRLFLIRSAACLRVIRFRQTGQYLTLLEVDAKNALHSVHFFLSPVW